MADEDSNRVTTISEPVRFKASRRVNDLLNKMDFDERTGAMVLLHAAAVRMRIEGVDIDHAKEWLSEQGHVLLEQVFWSR